MGYVGVEDVDAAAAKVTATGGTVHVPPTDIPNVGRFSVVADPHGAAFSLFSATTHEQDDTAQPDEPGRVGWHELQAGDLTADFAFYAGLFGWEKMDAMDMGEMGVYQMFGIGGTMMGGMMTKPPMIPVAHWGYYFNVASIDAAVERVKAAGGQIVHGPQEVPGGSFIVMGVDPQGASFALVGDR
jgi:predicted enzyme related to lactoylglutathione lyase